MISDESAYRQYLEGDEGAAELLVERYGDALTLYVHGYIRDLHEAEDLMIEAFSQLFAKERPLGGEGSFRAYLYRTARNLALRCLKGRRLRLQRLDELGFEPPSDVLTDGELLRGERNRRLYAALETLRAEYREALYLVYLEGMSYREAGRVLRRSEQQVRNLVYRGKQGLKATLIQEGFTDEDD